jgi:hypothetical protein
MATIFLSGVRYRRAAFAQRIHHSILPDSHSRHLSHYKEYFPARRDLLVCFGRQPPAGGRYKTLAGLATGPTG